MPATRLPMPSEPPGQRILDVSTGIGEPAVTLSKRVGADGSILATDQSAGMLAVARERIVSEGLSNIELVQVDTEVLDLPENESDGAVCRWGLMFLPDVQAGLQAIRRSLKPGAKFATTVWGTPPQTPMFSFPMAVARKIMDPAPPRPPADAPNFFLLGAPGFLHSAFRAAGFKYVEGSDLQIYFDLDSPQTFADFLGDIAPGVQAILSGRPTSEVEKFWNTVVTKVEEFVDENGTFKIPGTAPIAVGTK